MNRSLPTPVWGIAAAWAFSESAVGGLMHGLKLPLTGLTVGGFAVACLAAMAAVVRGGRTADERKRWSVLLQATLLVMAVKGLASPHTPATAYVAVGFQGLAAWVSYRLIPWHRLATVVFAVMALTESAVQKALIMTWVYGEDVWTAVDALSASAARQLPGDSTGSVWLLSSYIGLYVIWGAVLGLYLGGWPGRWKRWGPELRAQWLSEADGGLADARSEGAVEGHVGSKGQGARSGRSGRRGKWVLYYLLGLGFTLGTLAGMGRGMGELGWLLLRSVAATFLLFGVIGPAIRWWVGRMVARGDRPAGAGALLATFEEQGARWRCCYRWSRKRNRRGWATLRAVEYYLILAVEIPPANTAP
ncbi:MAG: hypothetical protein RJA19_1001 [Bacteroidota bacterium]